MDDDDNDNKPKNGELLPPQKRPLPVARHETTAPVAVPETGAFFSPYRKLVRTRQVWDAYSAYLTAVQRAHEANTSLMEAVARNKKAVQRLDYMDEILESDRLDFEDELKEAEHRREMAQLRRQTEREYALRRYEASKSTPIDDLTRTVQKEAQYKSEQLRLAKLEVEEKRIAFEREVQDQMEREYRAETMAGSRRSRPMPSKDMAERVTETFQAAFEQYVDEQGGIENVSAADQDAWSRIMSIMDEQTDFAEEEE